MSKKRLFHLQNNGPCRQWEFTKPRRQGQRERCQTKDLMSKTIALHVCYKSWYIPSPSSAKQHREMTKFWMSWTTFTSTAKFSFSFFFFKCSSGACYFPFLSERVFFSPPATAIFGCFRKRRNVKTAWRHYFGLYWVFCCLEQNAWSTFHVFQNRNSVSIEWLLTFIPLILIPEFGQSNAPLVCCTLVLNFTN